MRRTDSSTPTPANDTCHITNNYTYDLAVLEAYDNDPNTTKIMYEQTLSRLSIAGGAKLIKSGKQADVILDETYTDSSGKKQPKLLYEMIFAEPKTLFPIKNVSEMQSLTNNDYPPITVQAADANIMQLAYKFQQLIMAFPTSQLAKNFQVALSQAGQGTSETDISDKVDDFFKNTKEFQSLSFESYMTVMTYMQKFPNVFVNNAKSFTFYLYAAPAADNSSLRTNQGPNELGTVVFTKNASTDQVMDPSDGNAGYSIYFVSSEGQQSKLYYDHGQFVSDLNADIPPICLQGTFAQKSMLSGDKDNTLIPILVGSVNGQAVLGTNVQQVGKDGSDEGSWYAFWHPISFQGWVNLFLELIGVAFGIFCVFKVMAWAVIKLRQLTARVRRLAGSDTAEPTPEQRADITNKISNVSEKIRTNEQSIFNRNNEVIVNRVEIPSSRDFSTAVLKEARALRIQLLDDNLGVIQEKIYGTDATLEKVAKYSTGSEIEEVATKVKSLNDEVKQAKAELADKGTQTSDADLDRLSQEVKGFSANQSSINTNMNQLAEDIRERVSAEAQQELDKEIKNAEKVQKITEELNEAEERVAEGETGIDPEEMEDFPLPPAE